MGAGHDHGHHAGEQISAGTRNVLLAVLLPSALVVLALTAWLWESDSPRSTTLDTSRTTALVDATVVQVTESECMGAPRCQLVVIRPTDGPDAGQEIELPQMAVTAGVRLLHVGDEIVAARIDIPEAGSVSYAFSDFQRRAPLALLAVLFAVVVVAVARMRGVAALAGLAVTWLIISRFMIPSILAGNNAVLVAAVGSSLIMFVLLYLAHGINARTSIALLGTLVSLTLTTVLASVFIAATRLTGGASEEAGYLQAAGVAVDLQGLLLAGIVLGALGVLNDVTVTQTAAVWEVRRADASLGARDLYRSGMRVGRDHIASTVDTLVLAYVGASLPLVILFSLGNQPLGGVITGEIVADEILRTLVGSIGLVASVPITTALAAFVAVRQTPVAASAASADDEAPRRTARQRRTGTADSSRSGQRRDEPAPYRRPKSERDFWGEAGDDA